MPYANPEDKKKWMLRTREHRSIAFKAWRERNRERLKRAYKAWANSREGKTWRREYNASREVKQRRQIYWQRFRTSEKGKRWLTAYRRRPEVRARANARTRKWRHLMRAINPEVYAGMRARWALRMREYTKRPEVRSKIRIYKRKRYWGELFDLNELRRELIKEMQHG